MQKVKVVDCWLMHVAWKMAAKMCMIMFIDYHEN